MKYEIAFCFTSDKQESLKEGILPESAAKRLIKATLGLEPKTDNGNGDIRYQTDDAEVAMELLKMAFLDSDGGWLIIRPMPKDRSVFHLPVRK